MLNWIHHKLSSGPLYVRITRQRLLVVDVSTGKSYDDEPLMAVSTGAKKVILAIGVSARSVDGTKTNPFSHPRVLAHDFQALEKIFMHAFMEVLKTRRLRLTPIVVLQIDERLDGGLTLIESRALKEAAFNAGAYEVYIHGGSPLTNQQVKDGAYKRHAI